MALKKNHEKILGSLIVKSAEAGIQMDSKFLDSGSR